MIKIDIVLWHIVIKGWVSKILGLSINIKFPSVIWTAIIQHDWTHPLPLLRKKKKFLFATFNWIVFRILSLLALPPLRSLVLYNRKSFSSPFCGCVLYACRHSHSWPHSIIATVDYSFYLKNSLLLTPLFSLLSLPLCMLQSLFHSPLHLLIP